ncbi:MAG: nucleotidyltransferase family protein [Myxococcota bacterium]
MLAGRRGGEDPLAEAAGAPHRALLEIEGEPMLNRVVRRLLGWPSIERVLVNIDAPELIESDPDFRTWQASKQVEIVRSTDSPSQSVLESLDQAGLADGPVLVTTADHALLDDAMLESFFKAVDASSDDLHLALVPRRAIEARFPEAKRTYLRFKDEAYSGANLFLFRTPGAREAALFWRRVESQRKQPWRIARAFGLTNLALFLSRRLDLQAAFERVSRVVGIRVSAVPLPQAEAAVDVDKLADLILVREILKERSQTREQAREQRG